MPFATVHETLTQGFDAADTEHLVNMPANVSADNLLLLIFTSPAGTHTTPSGWTLVDSASPGGASAINWSVFALDAVGTEGGTTVDVVTSTSQPGAAVVHQIYGWGGSIADDIDVGTTHQSAGASEIDLNAVTAGWGSADNLYIAAYGCANDDATFDPIPTNYGNEAEIVSGGGTDAGCTTMTCRRELAAASDNPGACTVSETQQTAGVAMVIEPGASGSEPSAGATPPYINVAVTG